MKKNKKVVYTAIFGGKDTLRDPEVVVDNFDYVCFTDTPIETKVWDVRVIEPSFPDDPRRNARKIKLLPHEYLPEYEISIWIDGNLHICGDPNQLLNRVHESIGMFDHVRTRPDSIDSVYAEADHILHRYARGVFLDDPVIIKKQVETYRKEGMPEEQVHYTTMVVVRHHLKPDVVFAMNAWWDELSRWSIRDQLSWPYVQWKHAVPVHTIPGDSRHNDFVTYVNHTIPPKRIWASDQILYRAWFFVKKYVGRRFQK